MPRGRRIPILLLVPVAASTLWTLRASDQGGGARPRPAFVATDNGTYEALAVPPRARVRAGELIVAFRAPADERRSEEHTSELQSHSDLVCRLLLEKKKDRRA